jgi:hypothetical protein
MRRLSQRLWSKKYLRCWLRESLAEWEKVTE